MAWGPAVQLVTVPGSKMRIEWQGEAVVHVLEQTGRRPYLVQLVCSTIIDYLNQNSISMVDFAAVTAVIDKIIREANKTLNTSFSWSKT